MGEVVPSLTTHILSRDDFLRGPLKPLIAKYSNYIQLILGRLCMSYIISRPNEWKIPLELTSDRAGMGHWSYNLRHQEAVALIVQQVSLSGFSLGYFAVGSVRHGDESRQHEAPAPLAVTARRPRETNAGPRQPFSILFR